MLVSMKAAGPSIERSTWLSAARCITASGWCVAKMRVERAAVADVGLLEGVAVAASRRWRGSARFAA